MAIISEVEAYVDSKIEKLRLELMEKITGVHVSATVDIDRFEQMVERAITKEIENKISKSEENPKEIKAEVINESVVPSNVI